MADDDDSEERYSLKDAAEIFGDFEESFDGFGGRRSRPPPSKGAAAGVVPADASGFDDPMRALPPFEVEQEANNTPAAQDKDNDVDAPESATSGSADRAGLESTMPATRHQHPSPGSDADCEPASSASADSALAGAEAPALSNRNAPASSEDPSSRRIQTIATQPPRRRRKRGTPAMSVGWLAAIAAFVAAGAVGSLYLFDWEGRNSHGVGMSGAGSHVPAAFDEFVAALERGDCDAARITVSQLIKNGPNHRASLRRMYHRACPSVEPTSVPEPAPLLPPAVTAADPPAVSAVSSVGEAQKPVPRAVPKQRRVAVQPEAKRIVSSRPSAKPIASATPETSAAKTEPPHETGPTPANAGRAPATDAQP